jgi:GT2 family glycosyltransferase
MFACSSNGGIRHQREGFLAMPEITSARKLSNGYRHTLHELNQRYHEAWNRAERLQDELDNIKKSRAYRLFAWWRGLANYWRPSPRSSPASRFTSESLQNHRGPAAGSVSILIPFKDRLDLLRNCLRSLRRGTYPHREVVLLDNGSTCPRTLHYFQRLQARSHFRVIPCPGDFNFSRICNRGVRHAKGDFLLFLNNDVEVLTPDWLEQLLYLANCPDIGIVGATLLYPDGTLQHAGIFPSENGSWGHIYRGSPQDYPGEHGELTHARSVPAVTGACLLIRRSLFVEMNGFDERYALTFNDVDLCRRARERGLKVAITPHARLWHFESISRGFSREAIGCAT